MSAVAHPSALAGSKGGGVAARRAVIRWALRLFRREWRQQILVLALLTVAVAAAVGSITIVHNTGPDQNFEFGSATVVAKFDGSDPRKLRAGLALAKKSFGTIDVIAHRSVAVPGGVETVDFRAQDPDSAFGVLALRQGSYPAGPGQVAVTDGVADLLRLDLGSTLALDGHRRNVVGIVENPHKLSDEFALVSPSSAGAAQHVTVLAQAEDGDAAMDSFFAGRNGPPAFAGMQVVGNDHSEGPALAMFSVTTVFLLLASLVAAAGFAVVAQRRLRQLGMLAAVGGTQKHVRLALLANGAIVGAIGAVVGTAVGFAAWVVFAPTLESAVDHRIGRLSLPWWLVAVTGLLAILGATASAWWPGRAVARLPIVLALSGRPPRPRPARHSALAAAFLSAIGIGCLALSDRETELLIVVGIVATILGALLLGPLAIRIFSGLAGRVPIAPRLALRDLSRYQARSGAALAAVTLAVGIAATVVVIASAEAAKLANEPARLSDRQVRVYLAAQKAVPVDAPAQLGRLTAGAREIAAQLDGATLLPLRKVVEPGAQPAVDEDTRVFPTIELTKAFTSPEGGKSFRAESELFVATPAVLRYLGIDPATVEPGTDYLVDRSVSTSDLVIPSMKSRKVYDVANVQKIETGGHLFGAGSGRTPPYFITLGGLRRHGWKRIPAGWLVESSRPLTSDQIADARRAAADAGLTIEVKEERASNARTMAIATAAGAVLALAILAMTVGLIRSESAGDLRTLTATGATSRIRRTLTATTAGALAFLGALLGVAGAYVVLAATYHDDLGYLSDVPVLWLILAVVGVPLAAAAAGWLLAGREPPAIARPVIE
ncbi:MAG TPA: ABC transporter permease [Gaiellaceae bacterium]|nr:ABC transporter permease [Gaiellaceae bacterium]